MTVVPVHHACGASGTQYVKIGIMSIPPRQEENTKHLPSVPSLLPRPVRILRLGSRGLSAGIRLTVWIALGALGDVMCTRLAAQASAACRVPLEGVFVPARARLRDTRGAAPPRFFASALRQPLSFVSVSAVARQASGCGSVTRRSGPGRPARSDGRSPGTGRGCTCRSGSPAWADRQRRRCRSPASSWRRPSPAC